MHTPVTDRPAGRAATDRAGTFRWHLHATSQAIKWAYGPPGRDSSGVGSCHVCWACKPRGGVSESEHKSRGGLELAWRIQVSRRCRSVVLAFLGKSERKTRPRSCWLGRCKIGSNQGATWNVKSKKVLTTMSLFRMNQSSSGRKMSNFFVNHYTYTSRYELECISKRINVNRFPAGCCWSNQIL